MENTIPSGLLRRGAAEGGGDLRVAYRGQAEVQDDGQQDDVWKSESEMWRLRKI